jgi:hypothetical protein
MLAACGAKPVPEAEMAAEAAGERIENLTLGLAIAALPPSLEVVANEGERLQFATMEESGTINVYVDPPETGGINLVAAHRAHKEEVEAKGGTYKGRLELGSPFGTTFLSRGVFTDPSQGELEEAVILFIHPMLNRKTRVVYHYPAPDSSVEDPNAYSKERLEGILFELLGEIEGLPAADSSGG